MESRLRIPNHSASASKSSFLPPSSVTLPRALSTSNSSPAGLTPGLSLMALNCETPFTPNVSPVESKSHPLHPQPPDYHASDNETPRQQTSPAFIAQQTSLILEDAPIRDFTNRTEHLFNGFKNSAESVKPLSTFTLNEVIRIALWWFLHGRMKLVPLIRESTAVPFAQNDNNVSFQEAHVNTAKCLWILQKTRNSGNEEETEKLREETGFQNEDNRIELLSLRLALLIRLRREILAMRKHGSLPSSSKPAPDSEETLIWIPYPTQHQNVSYLTIRHHVLASQDKEQQFPLSTIFPLGDTDDVFYYGGIHVEILLPVDTSQSNRIGYPAILSVVRPRTEQKLSAIIGSQDGLVKFSVSSDGKSQCRWQDVRWEQISTTLEVMLRTGFRLHIKCGAWHFKVLRGMYDYEVRTLGAFQELSDERLIFESGVESVEYQTNVAPETPRFPTGIITHLNLRLFESRVLRSTGTGSSHMHRAFRLAIMTPPWQKNLDVFNQYLTPAVATNFGFLRGDQENRTLYLRFVSEQESLNLAFSDPQKRTTFLAHLTGCFVREQETTIAQMQIHSFGVSSGVEALVPIRGFDEFKWQRVRVIHAEPMGRDGHRQQTLSESLRIIVDAPTGRLTDRVNIGIGELKIRRNVIASGHELQILRQPQEDITFSLSDLTVTNSFLGTLRDDLHSLSREPSVRTYHFLNLSDLHDFQSAVTGFSVLFDGTPSSFSISRRRPMIPLIKEWAPPHTRVQILKRGKVVQLVAFFEGFAQGKCMNFRLKETDIFETFSKSGANFLRIVDTKFSLPAGGKNDNAYESGFVCLDLLGYPSEHSNICIRFVTDSDFVRFSAALPGVVKKK